MQAQGRLKDKVSPLCSHVVLGMCFRVFSLPVSGATFKIFVERERMSCILSKDAETACTYLVQYDTGKL